MSEVGDQAKDTEVDGGATTARATDEVSRSTPHIQLKEEIVDSKDEGTDTDKQNDREKDVDMEGDSEAETLIQSPEKKRITTDSAAGVKPAKEEGADGDEVSDLIEASNEGSQSRKRKRSSEDGQEGHISPSPSRRSSPLSSPIAIVASADSDSDHQGRRKISRGDDARAKRNGERQRSRGPESKAGVHSLRQRRPSDIVPQRRDKPNSDTTERRETRSATYPRHSDDERSPSPQPIPRREYHKRGVSTQLTSHELGIKKRGRPPLINTTRRNRSADRAPSVSSDDSNSPAPPRSAAHKLMGQDHDTMSPAKTGPRKWRDKNGRTFLARACNNNDLESAKARLAERPEDLNWADNAGNTPLQIAALEGFIDIVKFLLEANCEIDTRNIDKETPLIDAVENGHVEVVKLLLDHGANPRLGNAKGDEPYELVPQDDENYEEIRGLIADSKEREGRKNKAPDQSENANRDGASSRAASAASPRDSPPVGPRSPPPLASRRRTGRSESTRNDLLWQANTQENLTKLAGKGDVQGVASILNILQKAETESLIAAAKAGHEEVLQYLLGMGDPDPDPDPVRTLKPGFNTPMLAAIGRGHVDVVKLLVSQSGFNPTRKYKDKTYYEMARERKGEDWQHEYDILKNAYENYGTSKGRKAISPRKTRDVDKLKVRPVRRSSSPASQKRLSSSPTMTQKSLSSTKSSESSPRDQRKLAETERRKVSGSKLDVVDNAVAVTSDHDQTVASSKKGHRVRRSQSDLPAPSKLEPEPLQRRRRLVTGKEHRRIKSNAPGSESEEESKAVILVKQEEKPNATLKRARSRSSNASELQLQEEADKARVGLKKRRTVLESSPDEARNARRRSHLSPQTEKSRPGAEIVGESVEVPIEKTETMVDIQMANTEPEKGTDESIEEKEKNEPSVIEPNDPEVLPDVDQDVQSASAGQVSQPSNETVISASVNEDQPAVDPTDDDTAVKEKAAAEAQATAEREAELAAERAAAEAAEAELKAKAEAERVEAARKAAEEEEEARRVAEQKAIEEAEIQRKIEEEALRKQREEEEARQEQLRREMEDRRRQQYLESERRRREMLPVVLNKVAAMLDDDDPTATSQVWLSKFLPLFTVQTRQFEDSDHVPPTDDQWVANFQVASLLATKDLNLSDYTSFQRRTCTDHERQCLWRVARNMLSFEYEANGANTTVKQATARESENRPKFLAMKELFWIKLSDFNQQASYQSHLTGLILRTQPISLASYTSLTPASTPSAAQVNGISSAAIKMVNGLHMHVPQTQTSVD